MNTISDIPLRIAQVAPLTESVPPKTYGGTERIVSFLTEELVTLGHDVTLFASGDSITNAELRPMCPRALRFDTLRDSRAPTTLMIELVAQAASEFDIIHLHIDHMPFSVMRRIKTPSLTTLHGRLDLPELLPVFREFIEMPVNSISLSQRPPLAFVNWVGNIYHGLPPMSWSPRENQGYLAFLGRICPEKAPDVAVRLARQSGHRLRVAAKVDAVDQDYYEEVMIDQLAEPHVEYIGEITENEKPDFLGHAKALLFPGTWPEPFGLVMIEAMRTGTPVVAFRHGSVDEVIEDGVTGFIVDSDEEALDAINRVDELNRDTIRSEFERRFTAQRMAEDYVKLYRSMVFGKRRGVFAES